LTVLGKVGSPYKLREGWVVEQEDDVVLIYTEEDRYNEAQAWMTKFSDCREPRNVTPITLTGYWDWLTTAVSSELEAELEEIAESISQEIDADIIKQLFTGSEVSGR